LFEERVYVIYSEKHPLIPNFLPGFFKTAAKGISLADLPENGFDIILFSEAAGRPLNCRIKNSGKQVIPENKQFKQ